MCGELVMPITEYIKAVWGSVLYSWVGKTATLFPLLIFITTLYSYKPKKSALLVVSVILSFLQATPIFAAYYFAIPNSLTIFYHAIFVHCNPFLIFAIYPLLKYYVHIPANRCAAISKKAIGYLNIPICMFMAVQELLLDKMEWEWTNRVTIDNYAAAICILISVAIFIAAYAFIQKKNIRVKIPSNLSGKKHQLLFAFLEVLIIYITLVLFRMIFVVTPYVTPYDVESYRLYYVCYGLIIVLWFGYLILDIYRDILFAKQYEAENLMTHIAVLDDVNEQYRALKHDINNMMQVYSGYIEVKDWDKLRDYHQSVFRIHADSNLKFTLSRELGNYLPLYSLLVAKSDLANAHGVNFDVAASKIKPGIQVSDVDLCRIMGVLLDNAVEAAVESSKKKVSVSFEEREDSLVIIVSNSCEQPINLRQIFLKEYSTKGSGRGLGLYEVDKMVKKNEHVSLNVSQHDNMVTFYFAIEYPQALV